MNKNFSGKNISGEMKNAIKNADTASLMSSLSAEDKKVLDTLLNDDARRQEFLSSPEAKAIISALFKGR
ncbi:MAG: hypothetical protein IIW94_01660 [Clostridia bacterium]|nr:hypothetical protein [Clostridia bacterium]